ncbi:MAG: hypothetical protein GKR77_00015 [Legionellales bacterium]|nr:hypothetical protein [Legionellales bacterium]
MNELASLHALITRPQSQAQRLAQRISSLGGQVELFATINIIPRLTQSQLAAQLAKKPAIDQLIFISPNAITQGCPLLQQTPTIAWRQLPCIAMGEPSANLLRDHGAQHVFYPTPHYSAEDTLTLPSLQLVTQQHIVIFKGEGGRPLLTDTLRERGAQITEIICYQRALPTPDPNKQIHLLQTGVNAIISTSIVSADNLWTLFAPTGTTWLQQRQWVVSSQRIANHLQRYSLVHKPLIAQNASDDAMISTLLMNATLFSRQPTAKGI